jgi:hypothetical protein
MLSLVGDPPATDRDQAAIKDVFVFVEDECGSASVARRPGQAVAARSVPVEAFELFVVECEDHLEGIERDALALEQDPPRRTTRLSVSRHPQHEGQCGSAVGALRQHRPHRESSCNC